MGSIPPTSPKTQEQQSSEAPLHKIAQFRYAFRLTPERIKSLTPQQREEALLEFITLLSLIVSIIYNPVAKEATRLLALDVILTQVQRSARKLISAVTDKSPTYAPETEKRLGLSKNTISMGYKTLEKAGVLERSYRTDEITHQDHLDIAPTPALFIQPSVIRDKKKRAAPKPKLQIKPVDPVRECLSCGSHDLRITCRRCGSFIDLGEVEHVCQHTSEPDIQDNANTSESIPITNFVTTIQNEVLESFPITAPREDGGVEEELQSIYPNTSENEAVTNFGTFSPITPPHVPAEEPPVVDDSSEEVETCSYRKRITTWLEQRIGEGQIIYATGSTDQDKKYKSLPVGTRPDLVAYLDGDPRHIYGCRLATAGNTSVLGFDVDKPEQDARCDVYLQQLREAGAFPLYWHRQNNRGHLEVYFSEPVNAEAAYNWCLSVCPELADIPECYPVNDKKSNGFSWPLYQRVGNSVYECPVSYPARQGCETIGGMISDPYAVETLIEMAVTPASLIPPTPPAGDGGVLLEKTQEDRPSSSNLEHSPDTDLADVVIANFNERHTWEEAAALCGGLKQNRFRAVWRGEKHASVVIDPDGLYACDHGRIGTTYLKKLDKYEVWCLAQGIEKTKDLAERIARYRRQQDTSPASWSVNSPACQLAKKMASYEVLRYLPNVPCTCGCELWRPVFGTMECCRCSPHPLWPNTYDQAIRELYPKP